MGDVEYRLRLTLTMGGHRVFTRQRSRGVCGGCRPSGCEVRKCWATDLKGHPRLLHVLKALCRRTSRRVRRRPQLCRQIGRKMGMQEKTVRSRQLWVGDPVLPYFCHVLQAPQARRIWRPICRSIRLRKRGRRPMFRPVFCMGRRRPLFLLKRRRQHSVGPILGKPRCANRKLGVGTPWATPHFSGIRGSAWSATYTA